MSASVEEAAAANADLSSSTDKTVITSAEGHGTMRAGAFDPVSRLRFSQPISILTPQATGTKESRYQGCTCSRARAEPVSGEDGIR